MRGDQTCSRHSLPFWRVGPLVSLSYLRWSDHSTFCLKGSLVFNKFCFVFSRFSVPAKPLFVCGKGNHGSVGHPHLKEGCKCALKNEA